MSTIEDPAECAPDWLSLLRRCTSTTACCWSMCLATGQTTRTRCAGVPALPRQGYVICGALMRTATAGRYYRTLNISIFGAPNPLLMSWLAGAPIRAGHHRKRPGAAADGAGLPGPLRPRLPRAGGCGRTGGLLPDVSQACMDYMTVVILQGDVATLCSPISGFLPVQCSLPSCMV